MELETRIAAIGALWCDLCIFGPAAPAMRVLDGLGKVLPAGARIVVITEDPAQPFCSVGGANDHARGENSFDLERLAIVFRRWRTGHEVLVRRGCRVQSCEDYTAFDGRKGLLICYRSLTLPDAPRLVRAARIIETRGFERAA